MNTITTEIRIKEAQLRITNEALEGIMERMSSVNFSDLYGYKASQESIEVIGEDGMVEYYIDFYLKANLINEGQGTSSADPSSEEREVAFDVYDVKLLPSDDDEEITLTIKQRKTLEQHITDSIMHS